MYREVRLSTKSASRLSPKGRAFLPFGLYQKSLNRVCEWRPTFERG